MIYRLKNIFLIAILFSACTIPRKYQKNKPFVFKNNIELNGGKLSADEKSSLKQKMFTQLDDSMKTTVKDFIFALHILKSPPVFDSVNMARSAKNLKNTLTHIGYYNAKVVPDSQVWKARVNLAPLSFLSAPLSGLDRLFRPKIRNLRIQTDFVIDMGNPTLIDTFSYQLKTPELQQLAEQTREQSLIKEGNPVTKADVLGEISRLVELYRNNGYYKFNSDELRMRGDTSIEALTSVSDDPFETIRLLAEANEKRNNPTIKLAMVQNPGGDSSRLLKYYVSNIYIYPDYTGDDSISVATYKADTLRNSYIMRYHRKIVKKKFLLSHLVLKKGDLFRQNEYNSTINNFSKTGVWQNVNVQVVERKDSIGKLDIYVQLVPTKKYGFEGKVEASYSTNSNANSITVANAGNLLGLSGNISAQTRNGGRQGIKITHTLRTGVELNLNERPSAESFINSSDVGYNLTFAFPKLMLPRNLRDYFNREKRIDTLYSKQSFLGFSASNTNRIGLFKLNSFGLSAGYEWSPKFNKTWSVKLVNIEFSNLYNRSYAFDSTIKENPFLRYSFNTALVFGMTVGHSSLTYLPRRPNRDRVFSLKWNIEESGWFLGVLPLKDFGAVNKYLKNFIKGDVEAIYSVKKIKSEKVARVFLGVGIPIGSSDTTLPFFKQYFGGGPNSMRAWPIRGIGPGSKALPAYGPNKSLSDRTGDIRFEANVEYRKDLWQMIPNTLTLKWALFADMGNVWNFKNTQPDGSFDSTQLSFKNLYHDIGMNVGTGFRFDFNYVTLRFDFGFRVKRPELSENGGWKLPAIGFNDLWGKIFEKGKDDEYRKWRYENFNFTIGLNYPF